MSGELSASAVVGDTVTFHHLLHIEGYSQIKEDFPNGESIKCRPFHAGRWSWYMKYVPNFSSSSGGFISVYLCLDENLIPLKGKVRFSLFDQAGKQVVTKTTGLVELSNRGCGYADFIKKTWLEQSELLKDDCFTIRCDAVIYTGLRVEDRSPAPAPPRRFVAVPPSDLHRHFGDLLAHKEGADVTFQVAGETFQAHRCVLAARSPVFRAQLLGPMKEAGVVVNVDDMNAQVFRALLCFAYTDALPECPDADKQEQAALAQHLLVAADRYNLERLKLICEDRLCDRIEPGTVVTILALAEQHHCRGLKNACFQFLSTPMNLSAVMATDGFDHLTRSCPSVVKELLMSNIASRMSI